MATTAIFVASFLAGLGIGNSVIDGNFVQAFYGVALVVILICMHDVVDTRRDVVALIKRRTP